MIEFYFPRCKKPYEMQLAIQYLGQKVKDFWFFVVLLCESPCWGLKTAEKNVIKKYKQKRSSEG